MVSAKSPLEQRPADGAIRRFTARRAVTLLFILHPTLCGLGAFLREQPIKAAYKKYPYCPNGSTGRAPSLPPPQETENIFVNALVQAASCHKHARRPTDLTLNSGPGYTYHKARRRMPPVVGIQKRSLHHTTNLRPAMTRTSPSREEYLNLVDTYRELYTQAQWIEPNLPPHLLIGKAPKTSKYVSMDPTGKPSLPIMGAGPQPPLSKSFSDPLAVKTAPQQAGFTRDAPSEKVESSPAYQEQPLQPDVVHLLCILEASECTHEEAYKAYSALPSPGVSHLSEPQIRLLFRRLSTIEKKGRETALHYLSVVDDMKSLDFALTEAEWNSAIAFCGQTLPYIGHSDVENALLTWKEMEKEANVQSGNVTFNILFDMAAKAGKFVLADMIKKEMESRGLIFNRYFRVGNIYLHGLRGDSDGIRLAYRDLVEAGEVVDTIVMNCVIAALISAGELASAENVYDRMKTLLSKHGGRSLPAYTWQEVRDLGRILDRLARYNRRNREDFELKRLIHLKEQISIVPNVHTYAIFIEHHAWHTGDLRRVAAMLNDMQILGLPIEGRIFLKLFKGFAKHGGGAYTVWSPSRLHSVWNSFIEVLDAGDQHVEIRKWIVIWAVRAFARCAGREWALHTWEEMRHRWDPTQEELQSANSWLQDTLGG